MRPKCSLKVDAGNVLYARSTPSHASTALRHKAGEVAVVGKASVELGVGVSGMAAAVFKQSCPDDADIRFSVGVSDLQVNLFGQKLTIDEGLFVHSGSSVERERKKERERNWA